MMNTKEKILVAALRLFAVNGYEAVSVSQIAGELGITKGALYKHYKTKEIFLTVYLNTFADWMWNAPRKSGVPEQDYSDMPEAFPMYPQKFRQLYERAVPLIGVKMKLLVIFVKCLLWNNTNLGNECFISKSSCQHL